MKICMLVGAVVLSGCAHAPSTKEPSDEKVVGGLSKEAIRQVIQQGTPAIRDCYEAERVSRPDAAGKLVVKFVIAPDGKVSSAEPGSSTLPSPQLDWCVVEQVKGWQFPSPNGGGIVKVSYPFIFKQKDSEIEVAEGLPKEVVRAAIRERYSEVRTCYEKELASTPELHGKVKIRFVISREGKVESTETIKSTTQSPSLDACVVERVKLFQFPANEKTTQVIYPFIFKKK